MITRNLFLIILKVTKDIPAEKTCRHLASDVQVTVVHSTGVGIQSRTWEPIREDTRSTAGPPITDKHQIRCAVKIVGQGGVEIEWINNKITST